jgi:hypothetical protein
MGRIVEYMHQKLSLPLTSPSPSRQPMLDGESTSPLTGIQFNGLAMTHAVGQEQRTEIPLLPTSQRELSEVILSV